MRISIVTPAPRGSRKGNRITAERWARVLRRLGHRVDLRMEWDGERCDLLVALHARRSLASIERYLGHGQGPLVLTLTGTDLYDDIRRHAKARSVLHRADRLVLLQAFGVDELPEELRSRVVVLHQSATASRARLEPRRRTFDVALVAHLRPVKDPFRAAEAARRLDASSRLRILHAGEALDAETAGQAQRETASNPRYRWLGELPQWRVRQLLKRSRAMVLTSRMEGGANVIGEAAVAGCPVVASRIAGSAGLLGEDYPGYFEVGDTEGLAALFRRLETEPAFLDDLAERCRRLASLFDPAREEEGWRKLLRDLSEPAPGDSSPGDGLADSAPSRRLSRQRERHPLGARIDVDES